MGVKVEIRIPSPSPSEAASTIQRSWRKKGQHPLFKHKSRTSIHRRGSTSKQMEDMSASKLFKLADKAEKKGVQVLKDEKNFSIAKLKSRLRWAEARGDRECARADKAERELDAALLRALKAEARCDELSNISVTEVLKFVIKNSNTAQKTMGREVRPM